ncbi:MAG: glycosyltransferase family 4 protein [Pseudomonadota bacterium]
MPELVVTNFNRNFTGVSSTTASVLRQQVGQYDLVLAGRPLPGCPTPVSRQTATRLSRSPVNGRPFTIWHVRRNTEMRAALWARDILRLPIKIVFTSAARHRHSAFPRFLISRMDAVVATTQEAADLVPNVFRVVPHGVDTEVFTPAKDRAAAWAATGFPGKRGIATMGRIRPAKGTDRFVEVMLRLLPQHDDVTAVITGRAMPKHQNFLTELKTKVAQAGLSERILFAGELPVEKMHGFLSGLSLMLHLPRYEPFGVTPLEALASGVPFIATETGGQYRELTCEGRTGLIVEEDDIEATVAAASGLLTSPDRHADMAKAAREAALTRFSIAHEAAGIADVYERVWRGEPAPR